jgi:Asp-tRNA(Asn)/Glu-tRNA(Gln) amidotransferase A subunit family amidase
MENLLALSAANLVRRIRAREISPREVVESHIARIEAVNPAINALVTPLFEQAIDEAHLATKQLVDNPNNLPPLFGLPVTIKDALAVAGVRFTAGTAIHHKRVAKTDAEVVKRFKAAGAIILGKTNCPDMSSSVETNNRVFGLTRNPWNLDHSAGGSSGGEGALISAGGSPLGLGSDFAGSIRIPAAFCGVCGLKPTGGRISIEGHDPPMPDAMRMWNTVGPMARRVEDLALALSVLSNTPVKDYTKIKLAGRPLIIPKFMPTMPVRKELRIAVREASEALQGIGMDVREGINLPILKLGFEMNAIVQREWFPMVLRALDADRPMGILREMVANWRGKGRIGSNTLALMMATSNIGWLANLVGFGSFERIAQLRAEVLEIMGVGGLILWPVYPTSAPRHGFSWGPYGIPIYTPVFNVLGYPAVSVPIGWSEKSLPLGVQIVGQPDDDEGALAAAAVLEQAFGGWRIAPL